MNLVCVPCIIKHQTLLAQAKAADIDPNTIPAPKEALTIAQGFAVCWTCLPEILSPAPPPGQTRSGLLVPTRG